jgi:hypothetical protein
MSAFGIPGLSASRRRPSENGGRINIQPQRNDSIRELEMSNVLMRTASLLVAAAAIGIGAYVFLTI